MEADFSGYVTKAGLKCSDGRTITPEAFKHQDQLTVPLVWQHGHDSPDNVLGHVLLEARADGIYGYGYFNATAQGQSSKLLVEHKDIKALSIYANQLIERSKNVLHGNIREVSLALAGANPGAFIDFVRVQHSEDPADVDILEDEAIISTGLELEHNQPGIVASTVVEEPVAAHADSSAPSVERTIQEVYDTLSDEQKDVVTFMIGAALETTGVAAHTEDNSNVVQHVETGTEGGTGIDAEAETTTTEEQNQNAAEGDLAHQEGNEAMTRNVFEQQAGGAPKKATLTHDQLRTIVEDTKNYNGSLRDSFLAHAQEYGIEDIDVLFPDAKAVSNTPELISRRMDWVAAVIDGTKHSPFSRIKSTAADITAEEARARGYVKGTLKKDEIIRLLKRITTPTTIYKKQKLDRDDIVDITDLDVVAFLKAEMRLMLDEELAGAVLVGDGREPDDDDKINEENIRPIAWDDEMYAHAVTVPANTTADGYVEYVLRARKFYKGTGTPTLFTTDDILTDMILLKDRLGRRLYNTEQELAAALRVKEIVTVEVMERFPDLLAVIVSLSDYTLGADKGGNVSMFDDFDIDYNQYKYLIETRVSGALTKPKAAVVLKRASGTNALPTPPTFDPETNTITIPTVTGVTYYNVTDPLNESALQAGPVVITETTDVEARANTGYHFPHNTDDDWTFAFNPDAGGPQ